MFLNQTAIYALRAMSQLATLDKDLPMRSRDLSRATGIPVHYLSKIMRRMVTAGLLTSQRGHGGGFVLQRPLDEIRFIDIFDALDVESQPNKCVFGWGQCNEIAPCPLHKYWSNVTNTLREWAQNNTLADVRTNARTLNVLDNL